MELTILIPCLWKCIDQNYITEKYDIVDIVLEVVVMWKRGTYRKILGLVLMLLVVMGFSFTVALSVPLDGEWIQKNDTPKKVYQ
jgi:hypothetical protein